MSDNQAKAQGKIHMKCEAGCIGSGRPNPYPGSLELSHAMRLHPKPSITPNPCLPTLHTTSRTAHTAHWRIHSPCSVMQIWRWGL